MANYVDESDLRDELTCSICLDLFEWPVTLPCAHTYCRACLQGLLATRTQDDQWRPSLACPRCRQVVLFRNGIDDLHKNTAIANLVASLRRMREGRSTSWVPNTRHNPVPAEATASGSFHGTNGKTVSRGDVKKRLCQIREELEQKQEMLIGKQAKLQACLHIIETTSDTAKTEMVQFFERFRQELFRRESILLDQLRERQRTLKAKVRRWLAPIEADLSVLAAIEETISQIKRKTFAGGAVTESEMEAVSARMETANRVAFFKEEERGTEEGEEAIAMEMGKQLRLSPVDFQDLVDRVEFVEEATLPGEQAVAEGQAIGEAGADGIRSHPEHEVCITQ